MKSNTLKKSLLFIGLCGALAAQADMGVYVKAGTLGAGGGVGYAVTDAVTGRVGFTTIKVDHDFHTTDVDYTGKFKLGGTELMLDWHPFSGNFRVTGGVVIDHNKVDIDARLNHTPIYINGVPYNVNDLASIKGEAKFKSNVPYIGIGWGNAASKNGGFQFIADLGVEYLGSAKIKLNGTCSAQFQSDPMCTQFKSDVANEEAQLNKDVADYKWWPVLSLGVAYRF